MVSLGEEDEYPSQYTEEVGKAEEEIKVRSEAPTFTDKDHEAQKKKMEQESRTEEEKRAEDRIKELLEEYRDSSKDESSKFWERLEDTYFPRSLNPSSDYLFHMLYCFTEYSGELSYKSQQLLQQTKQRINQGIKKKKYSQLRYVDIEKIAQPPSNILLRKLNNSSVGILKELIGKNPWRERRTMKCLAYREINGRDYGQVWGEMKEHGDYILYVIDGNHTRAALEELYYHSEELDDNARAAIKSVEVVIYFNLTRMQLRYIGKLSNELNEFYTRLTYPQRVDLIRREIYEEVKILKSLKAISQDYDVHKELNSFERIRKYPFRPEFWGTLNSVLPKKEKRSLIIDLTGEGTSKAVKKEKRRVQGEEDPSSSVMDYKFRARLYGSLKLALLPNDLWDLLSMAWRIEEEESMRIAQKKEYLDINERKAIYESKFTRGQLSTYIAKGFPHGLPGLQDVPIAKELFSNKLSRRNKKGKDVKIPIPKVTPGRLYMLKRELSQKVTGGITAPLLRMFLSEIILGNYRTYEEAVARFEYIKKRVAFTSKITDLASVANLDALKSKYPELVPRIVDIYNTMKDGSVQKMIQDLTQAYYEFSNARSQSSSDVSDSKELTFRKFVYKQRTSYYKFYKLNILNKGQMSGVCKKRFRMVIGSPPYGLNKGKWDKKAWSKSDMKLWVQNTLAMDIAEKFVFIAFVSLDLYGPMKEALSDSGVKKFDSICMSYTQKNQEAHSPVQYGMEFILIGYYSKEKLKKMDYCETQGYVSDLASAVRPVKYKYRNKVLNQTQLPVKVLRKLIGMYSRVGDWILDSPCGSGSTLAACALEGRNCVAIDNDTVQINGATKRIKELQEACKKSNFDDEGYN